ncbi:hypothetical protein HY623_00240 [Candidatus Uhrbacteria bacterium]|nr:hypothetical protein [Candidatus Uhrbacteria bacterium]
MDTKNPHSVEHIPQLDREELRAFIRDGIRKAVEAGHDFSPQTIPTVSLGDMRTVVSDLLREYVERDAANEFVTLFYAMSDILPMQGDRNEDIAPQGARAIRDALNKKIMELWREDIMSEEGKNPQNELLLKRAFHFGIFNKDDIRGISGLKDAESIGYPYGQGPGKDRS